MQFALRRVPVAWCAVNDGLLETNAAQFPRLEERRANIFDKNIL